MCCILYRINTQKFDLLTPRAQSQTKTNHQTDVISHLLENSSLIIEFDQLEVLATANNLELLYNLGK